MTQSLTTTNVWLAIIAIASLAEMVAVVVTAVAGFRLYRRATAFIERAEDYVAPLAGKVNTVVSEAQDVVWRVQRLEERTRTMLFRLEDTARRVTWIAQRAWPVLGTWRAVSAAVDSFRGHRRLGNRARA